MNEQGPYTITNSQQAQQLVTSLLGFLGPEAAQLAPLIMKGLQIAKPDVAWDSIWSTNQTGYGVAAQRYQSQIDQMGRMVQNEFTRGQSRQAMDSMMRSMVSMEDWFKRTGNEQWANLYNSGSAIRRARAEQAYNDYITQQVEGYQQSGILPTMYNWAARTLGLDNTYETSMQLGSLAGTIAKRGFRNQDSGALLMGKKMALGLFSQQDRYNRADWGGFSSDSVAQLANSLAQTIDFSKDLNATNPDDVQHAIDRMVNTVNKYAKALAPLKDLFGNSIPAMQRAIEDATGRDLSSISTAQVERLASRMAHQAATGQLNPQMLSAITNNINQRIASYGNVPVFARASAAMQAQDVVYSMDGTSFSFATRQEAAQFHERNIAETYNSQGAELFSNLYAAWAENIEKSGTNKELNAAIAQRDAELKAVDSDTSLDSSQKAKRKSDIRAKFDKTKRGILSYDTFKNAYSNLAAQNNLTDQQAAMQLSGVNSVYDAQRYRVSQYARDAQESGLSGQSALEAAINEDKQNNKLRVMNDYAFVQLAGSTAAAGKLYDNIYSALERNTGILGMSDQEDMVDALLAQKDDNGKQIYTEAQARMMARGIQGLMGDQTTKEQLMSLASVVNIKKNNQEVVNMKKKSDAVEDLNKQLFSGSGNTLANLFSGGFSMAKLKNLMQSGTITDIASLSAMDQQEVLSATEMTTRLALESENGAAAAKKLQTYIFSTEGRTNEGFMREWEAAKKRSKQMQDLEANGQLDSDEYRKLEAEQNKAAFLMSAYANIGAESIDRFMKSDIYADDGTIMNAADAEQYRYKKLEEWTNAQNTGKMSMKDAMQREAVGNQLNRFKSDTTNSLSSVASEFQAYLSKDTTMPVDKAWNDFRAKKLEEYKADKNTYADKVEQLDKLGKLTNNAIAGVTGNSGQPGDMFNALGETLNKIAAVLDKLSRFLSEKLGDPHGGKQQPASNGNVPPGYNPQTGR